MSLSSDNNESSGALVAEVVETSRLPSSSMTSLMALFGLCVRQNCRGRRLLLLILVFSLPALLAILLRNVMRGEPNAQMESSLVYGLLTSALVPLAALLYACGMIGDEVEDQTLTYLLVRPIPKPALYVLKLVATIVIVFGLAAVFTVVTYGCLYIGTPEFSSEHIPLVAGQTIALLALAVTAYCALFGFLSLLFRFALLIGVVYIMLFEVLLANIDFVARRLTVTYYFKVLEEHWMHRFPQVFQFDMTKVPSASTSAWTLALFSLLITAIAAWIMAGREFRMKTPEGR